MVLWQTASVVFFGYLILVVMIRTLTPKSLGRILSPVRSPGLLIVAWSALDQPAATRFERVDLAAARAAHRLLVERDALRGAERIAGSRASMAR